MKIASSTTGGTKVKKAMMDFPKSSYLLDVWESFQRIRANLSTKEKGLEIHGSKVYCQTDEDGIIEEIFRRIGTTNRIFVEFGVQHGLENNTLALLVSGWSGLWIEADPRCVALIRNNLPFTLSTRQLSLEHEMVETRNINSIISKNISEEEIDLLSIDIDGNDFHVLKAITCVSPRVIAIEYNAKFPPPIQFCLPYQPSHRWDGSDNFGASLKFLEVHLHPLNYRLVGCNLSGANAFFVRNDLVGDHFSEPFTAEHHYQPARYFLNALSSGHPSSYITVENIIKAGSETESGPPLAD